MTNNCRPILTPTDCGPLDTTTAPAPPPTAAVIPDQLPGVGVRPEKPPLEQLDGIDLPDLSGVAHVASTAMVCGIVVIAMLVMIVAVAARGGVAPHRLRNFAIASLLLPAASALAGGAWSTPAVLFWTGATRVADGDFAGLRMMLALGGPVAMLVATVWWAWLLHKNASVGQKSLGRTERIRDAVAARKFQAAARAARLGAPYSVGDAIVLGTLADRTSALPLGVWQELTARHESWLTLPHKEVRRHVCICGTTGSGKTTLQVRYATSVLVTEWRRWQRWKDVPGMRGKHLRPLLAMIACKGGEDDKNLGIEVHAIAVALGIDPERIAMVMPGGDRLDIWNMPARDLRAILSDLLGAGQASTSEGQHFDEMRKRIISLVVDAPIGPPRSSAEFLERLNAQRLIDIWGGAPDVKRQVEALQAEKVPQLDDALIKCTNLFELLKDADGHMVFDGGKNIDDLDVLFVTVPGMDADAARAQVAAIIRMVMQRAGRAAADRRRSVTLALDETSAVATEQGSIGLEQVCERGRSQGVALVLSVQSIEGLAKDPWTVNRILKACAGGIILGYSENAGELCKHLGSVRRMLPSRHLIKGQRHGDEGQVTVGEMWLVDPDRVRRFDTGEIVYAKAGRAYWGRVVPVDRSALTTLPGTRAPAAASTEPGAAAVAA
ncbi:type IV secretion system DNA-binding domain-containing protein [Nocardia brasiliensis]|uniref:type IV secretion system DNA-binding domain-containing protein n=1 Tax=Nocardia brasiliensis TaxID=37326 RepID=UPI0024568255|nr:type IV secretion system DNA-binding domain-containing protein [Nocardia brasiliensis]